MNWKNLYIPSILIIISLRALSLNSVDFIEPTEYRYAAVSGHMAETGEWLIPQFPRGMDHEPYLGKPPLHFWLMAGSQKLFGFDEWTARLPGFICYLLTGLLLFYLGTMLYSQNHGFLLSTLWFGSILPFIMGGVVVLDMSLCAAVTGTLVSYMLLLNSRKRAVLHCIMFWSCMAASFMIKGPVGLFFGLFPVLVLLIKRKNPEPLKIISPLWGIPLLLILCAPWFYLAELENPGFLEYFFINENILRFLVRDYGDRYGHGHVVPYGSIWGMLLLAVFPFSPLLLLALFRIKKHLGETDYNETFLVILSWSVIIPCLFIFIRQMHFGYALPIVPGTCLLIAHILYKENYQFKTSWIKKYFRFAPPLSVSFSLAGVILYSAFSGFEINPATVTGLIILGLLITLIYPSLTGGVLSSIIRGKQTSLNDLSRVISGAALFFITLVFSNKLIFADEINEYRSPQDMVKYIAKNILAEKNQTRHIEVSYFGTRSFAFHYLSDHGDPDLPSDIKYGLYYPDENSQPLPDNLVLKKKDLAKFQDKSNYDVLVQEGNYLWLARVTEKEQTHPSAH